MILSDPEDSDALPPNLLFVSIDTLRADEKLDLEVEMEVLADRLKSGA